MLTAVAIGAFVIAFFCWPDGLAGANGGTSWWPFAMFFAVGLVLAMLSRAI
jgi:hypothetical protein